MFGSNSNNQSEAARSIFMSSVKGLANTGAVAAAFFLTPLLYGQSVGWIRDFTVRYYGHELAGLTDFVWFVLVALLTFFVARASMATLLVMGGLAVATRFL